MSDHSYCLLNQGIMRSTTTTVEEYINELPENRKEPIIRIRKMISQNLPSGFTETMNYGMIGYVVSHKIYPEGYHADPKQPLPFISVASQKNHISIYHMGMYVDKGTYDWFMDKYLEDYGKKPDMGKSCIRFRKSEDIPYELIGELATKFTPDDWIKIYQENIKQ